MSNEIALEVKDVRSLVAAILAAGVLASSRGAQDNVGEDAYAVYKRIRAELVKGGMS
ncbi:MAG: hypothetical protein KGO02_20955 [Alphaproteobacteria bacterium]|nr:hypothetical protein [Alphaproteobacteria bacterium]